MTGEEDRVCDVLDIEKQQERNEDLWTLIALARARHIKGIVRRMETDIVGGLRDEESKQVARVLIHDRDATGLPADIQSYLKTVRQLAGVDRPRGRSSG